MVSNAHVRKLTVCDGHPSGDVLMGREAGTSPFVCTHRKHVAGAALKLVHTKRILLKFHEVEEKVCKAKKETEAIFLSCFMTREFKPPEFHATFRRAKVLKEIWTFLAKTSVSREAS